MIRTVVRWLAIVLALLLVVLLALYGTWQLSRSRDFQLFGEIIPRVETSEKVVALTFDDGPTPEYTDGVLDVLRERGVKATFFLMGVDSEKNPEQVRAIIADGHELGNHTYSHPDMTLASVDKAKDEVERTDAALRNAGYSGEIHFRPPFGKKLIGLPLYLSDHDRKTITWDVEPESFGDIAADPELITAHVLEKTKPGSIIILHVMYKARETSRQALPEVIDGLQARGFRFVTVSELLAMRARKS
ncbi:MAG TPA: polysaccharide deacetylase family protein [Hyphomonadaceae bacterium]|jgi:peptidoglycan/xylan/chitin deacetylase (PgdA/CDA1 family)